jgi:glutathione S-transferase
MLIVHHLNESRSQRVLWLLEELGLDYEVRFYRRDPTTRLAPPELKQVHPLGKSPVLQDGETRVIESAASSASTTRSASTGATRPPGWRRRS